MYTVQVSGYDILFPFEPYSIQRAYMSQLLRCLKNKQHGLLESPTGTGKTLSILCSSLAWLNKGIADTVERGKEQLKSDLESCKDDIECKKATEILASDSAQSSNDEAPEGRLPDVSGPKIIYSSRTHSQLSQAMREMKRTEYNHIPAVILASRDQLCINPAVTELESIAAKNLECRTIIKDHGCSYFDDFEKKVNEAEFESKVVDIEDLLEFGVRNHCCPYYATKVLINKSYVLFSPYNYLLNSRMRSALGIELKDASIIFDEGHNIEQTCEECASAEIDSETLAICDEQLAGLIRLLKKAEFASTQVSAAVHEAIKEAKKAGEFTANSVTQLKNLLFDLERQFDLTAQKKEYKNLKNFPMPIDWMLSILETIDLEVNTAKELTLLIDRILLFFQSPAVVHALLSTVMLHNETLFSAMISLGLVADFLNAVYPDDVDDNDYAEFVEEFKLKYRVTIVLLTEEEKRKYKKSKTELGANYTKKKRSSDKQAWNVHLFCLSPSIVIKRLVKKGVNSIVITSGTLSPLDSFEMEMEISFSIKLQNLHVISDDQLKVCVIHNAHDGTELLSSFANREGPNSNKLYTGLGNTLLDYSRTIPDGILLFFTSYSVKDKCFEIWKQLKILEKIKIEKKIFYEPRNKIAFIECIEKFKNHIDDPNVNGAIFVGICRGKLSEGLDLANNYCRSVIVIGLPFPALYDPRVLQKQKYLDNQKNSKLTSKQWYLLQMKRAVNQAIGRVVRHKDDYGCVLLLDSRFLRNQDGLSRWIQKFVVTEDYRNTKKIIEQFFRNMDTKQMIKKEVKPEPFFQNAGCQSMRVSGIVAPRAPISVAKSEPMETDNLMDKLDTSTHEQCSQRQEIVDLTSPSNSPQKTGFFGELDNADEKIIEENTSSTDGLLTNESESLCVEISEHPSIHKPLPNLCKKVKLDEAPLEDGQVMIHAVKGRIQVPLTLLINEKAIAVPEEEPIEPNPGMTAKLTTCVTASEVVDLE